MKRSAPDAEIAKAAAKSALGQPLAVLGLLALRDDPPALALRAIALAQAGEFEGATRLLRRAILGFGRGEPIAVARCVVAEAEIALAVRELSWPGSRLERAQMTLERFGDHSNAVHARHLAIRRQLLLGSLEDAGRALMTIDREALPTILLAAHDLLIAELASRKLQVGKARTALDRATAIASITGNAILQREVGEACAALDRVAARIVRSGVTTPATLADVADVLSSGVLVVDVNRRLLCQGNDVVSFATRPVQLRLARELGAAWPAGVPRTRLLASLFGGNDANTSQRARLRVAVNRLRSAIASFADIVATRDGFRLQPHDGKPPAVLGPPLESGNGAILALLADGAAWSSASLAIVLGTSQRTVQRGLDELAASEEVWAVGRGRARRWTSRKLSAFTTALLLPGFGSAD